MSINYNTEHFIEQLNYKGHTSFLNPLEFNMLKKYVSSKKYQIYNLYQDSTKVMLYKDELPEIYLLKISTNRNITHQEVLREMFELGLKEETYGDIVIKDNSAYIYVLPTIKDYLIYNFKNYSKETFNIEEVPLEILNNHQPSFKELEIIVSSLRIDNVISNIIKTSRKEILRKFKDKEVVLNYQVITKYTTTLKEGDIFSVRKHGKYKFHSIYKSTKKGGYILKIKKYI